MHGGDRIAIAVAQRQRERVNPVVLAVINFAVGNGIFFRVRSRLADFFFIFGGDDLRIASVVERIDLQAKNARFFLQNILHERLRRRDARRVVNGRIAKITYGVRLGPKSDFADGKSIVIKRRHDQPVVQPENDLIGLALDDQRVPGVCGNFKLRPERLGADAVHHFVKTDVVAERAGADDVKVRDILKTENDAGHLLDRAADDFEPC